MMRNLVGARRRVAGAMTAVTALGALTLGAMSSVAAAPSTAGVVSRAVSFQVHNSNTSMVPCPSNGAAFTIRGHIVGLAPLLDGGGAPARAVVLDLHGLGYGEFYWRFKDVPGYDWTKMLAARGIVSVAVDRIGYGLSGHPAGTQTCFGAQADIAHQIVQALRRGSYSMDGGAGLSFARVGLTGHSAGGAIAQIEAYSYHDIDALLVLSYSDLGPSPRLLGAFLQSSLVCLGGGNPPGYAPLGQTDADFKALMFHNADPAVVTAATRQRSADPCGDYGSGPTTIVTDVLHVPTIRVPVLIAIGDSDALFPPPAVARAKSIYRTGDLTAITVGDTGHALNLERSAGASALTIALWLCAHSFCDPAE